MEGLWLSNPESVCVPRVTTTMDLGVVAAVVVAGTRTRRETVRWHQ